MRVLIFSQYFVPEITAARTRVEAFASGLAARGHEVEVICEVPNHPAGVVHEGYGGRFRDRRSVNGHEVTYVWVRTHPVKTTRSRLLLYGTYASSAVMAGALARRPDAIVATSPPLPTGAAAATVAARHRVPWVLDVRDLWPEAAVVLGELKGARAIAAAERLERRLYRSAAAIVTVTEPFREAISAHVPGKRIEVISNGTTRAWMEAGADPDPTSEWDSQREFSWMYAGNLGIAQGLEHAVEAQRLLGDGFRLVLLGEGPQRDVLRERAATLPAGAVEFRDLVQPEEAARQMREADALLVSLAPMPELAKFVPSKLFDSWALGRPVVLAAGAEAARLAAEGPSATIVPPGDPAALAAAVRQLRDEPRAAAEMALRARRLVADRYLREDGVVRLESLLRDVVGAR
jgi:glycosyltransferase involved in cell wall biosynthesis